MSVLDPITPYFPGKSIRVKCFPDANINEIINPGVCFQIILVKAGAGIVDIEGKQLTFSTSSIICLAEYETIRLVTPNTPEVDIFHFDPAWLNPDYTIENLRSGNLDPQIVTDARDLYFLRAFLMRNENYYGILNSSLETFTWLRRTLHAMTMQIANRLDKFWICRSRSYFIQALITISNVFSLQTPMEVGCSEIINDVTGDDIIGEIVTYLHTNYTEEIKIPFLERHFNLNRTSIAEKFKDTTGQTVTGYLRNLRLRTAASLLQETYIPINEVCDRVGYNDINHFGRVFKETYALSPKEYRNKYCWMYK